MAFYTNRAGQPWPREHPGGNLQSATGHICYSPAVQKTVRLTCHLTQGLFMRGHLPLHKKEGIFNWSFQHCSVAMAFGGLRKLIWEERTPVPAVAATLQTIFLVYFFFSLTCTFVVLDCPQLVQGKYSMVFFPFFLFFKKVTQSTLQKNDVK